ncbi:hypothetical protein G9A89_005966 [Geosiphon pyriformis]|nr:hypothetical protein G9A89_005966 [Geosiphon pyriformis]
MDFFSEAEAGGDLDAMWAILERGMVELADEFFGLELLIAKIVNKIGSGDMLGVDHLVKKWFTLDEAKACTFSDLVILDEDSVVLFKHLSLVCKEYKRSKMFESRLAKETSIRKAIEKCMESFVSNKGGMIRSVLDRPFHKVVLDYLVVNDDLVLEPKEVKSKVDKIMMRDDVFSGVMRKINMEELLLMVGGLPDDKTTGLSGISNELWKHGSEMVLSCLLVLLNACLSIGGVSVSWKKTWVSMIPKPYNWDGVLINICPIALIETARKIFSKILSDRISFACSKFSVLRGDNFSVLKGTSMQSLVFAVGMIVEDVLKKNKELWLVLQDMQKAYNSSSGGLFSYFAAGAFVDDTIWVGNCQAATQNILDIVSEFFVVNDISINNEKTVTIPINQDVKIASLSISGLSISIAKKGEAHYYLGIFLSTEGLLKLSVAKVHSDVCFFANVVLRKTITDKQFLYLVLAVLQPIVNYRTQFSFVSSNVYNK